MKNIYFFILFLSILIFNNCYGQVSYVDAAKPKSIPPPPNAAQLGKYGECSVSFFTGQPQIRVPLYEIKIKGLTLPIELIYNSSGNKVSDIASWVGLGWSINAGGVVTRTIKGIADELAQNGYTSGGGALVYNNFLDNQCSNLAGDEFNLLMDIAVGRRDGQPDEYTYNFGNYQGKFIFNYLGEIYQLPFNNQIKINIIKNSPGENDSIKQIIFITPDGFKYTFSSKDRTKGEVLKSNISFIYDYDTDFPKNMWETSIADVSKNYEYYNSWYLNEITSPNGSDRILIEYETDTIINTFGYNDQYFEDDQDKKLIISNPSTYRYDKISRTYSENTVEIKRIKKISWNLGYIDFIQDTNKRLDVSRQYGSSKGLSGYSLKEINVFNYRNELIRHINISTSYFNSTNANLTSEYETTSPGFFKRLRLDSVRINSEKYIFTYDTTELPALYSNMIDFWGYYRYMDTDSVSYYSSDHITDKVFPNRKPKPTIYVYPQDTLNAVYHGIYSVYPRSNFIGNEIIIPGCKRDPILSYAKANILEKISYPTGAYDSLIYELNQFQLDGITRNGPGLRIKQIATKDYDKKLLKMKNYSYSEGNITALPEFAKYNAANYDFAACCGASDEQFWRRITSIYSNSIAPNINVGYPKVDEENIYLDYSNIDGKISYFYSCPGSYNLATTNELCSECTDTLSPQLTQCIYNKTIKNTTVLDQLSGNYPGFDDYHPSTVDNFPFLENPDINFARGILLETKYFNNANKLVKDIINKYCFNINNEIFSVKADLYNTQSIIWHVYDVGESGELLEIFEAPLTLNDIRWGLKKQVIANLYKKETETIEYSNSNNISQNIFYSYNDHFQNTEIKRKESDGWWSLDRMKYPTDYEKGSSNIGISKLQEKNMIDEVIEKISLKKVDNSEFVTSGFLNFYNNNFLNNTNLYLTKQLNLLNPVSDFNFSTITGSTLTYNSNYQDQMFLYNSETYDNNNNLLQIKKADNSPTSYYFGYNETYPVVIAENISWENLKIAVEQTQSNLENLLSTVGSLTSTYQKSMWKIFNTNLRNNTLLLNALVTTYSYKPLVGITSKTDPSGDVIYFEYDSDGRLTFERDSEGNIIKKYKYHFINQP